jgi:hypothetical protein
VTDRRSGRWSLRARVPRRPPPPENWPSTGWSVPLAPIPRLSRHGRRRTAPSDAKPRSK